MNNRVGFARFDRVTTDEIPKITEELSRFRYFVIEKVIIEIWSDDISLLFQYAASIYLSTYSALEIPIFILIPQLLSTSYTPNNNDLCLTQSFFDSQVLRLPLFNSAKILSTNLNSEQKSDKGCMGGTFDHFHSGHLVFLTAAAYYTNSIGIGLSSFSILNHKNNSEFIQP